MAEFGKEDRLRDIEFEADIRSEKAFDVWREWLVNYSSILLQESMVALVEHDPVRGPEFAKVLKEYWGLKK